MGNPFSNESTIARPTPDDEETGDVSDVDDAPDPDDLDGDEPESDAHNDETNDDEELPESLVDNPEQRAAEHLFEAMRHSGKLANKSMLRYDDGAWEYDEENPASWDDSQSWMEDMWFDVITTAGHEHMRIAYEYGFKTGGRLDNIDRLAEDGIPIHFIDMDWHNPEFDRLVEACKKYEPEYVVGGDYTKHDPSHPDSNIELINERARTLDQYAENVQVVPHGSNQVQHVPDDMVVGYSVPTTYGAAEGELIDYHGRDIHLLGGAPAKQMRMIQEFGTDIVSIDGNAINKMANVANRYWTGAKWEWQDERAWYPDDPHPMPSMVQRDVAGSELVDPDMTSNRNFEAYERSVMHWGYKMRERWESGWFEDQGTDVLDF